MASGNEAKGVEREKPGEEARLRWDVNIRPRVLSFIYSLVKHFLCFRPTEEEKSRYRLGWVFCNGSLPSRKLAKGEMTQKFLKGTCLYIYTLEGSGGDSELFPKGFGTTC